MSFTLILQSNSPGELSSWVRPIVAEFKRQCPDSTVKIFLTPCQYASGQEFQIASAIPGVDLVLTPNQTLKYLLSWPLRDDSKTPGAVFYLGGDPLYSQIMGLKCKFPVYGYTEHSRSLGPLFKKVFYKKTDGDLMGARVASFKPNREAILKKYAIEDSRFCLFFCGSRPSHFLNLVPFISEVVSEIKQKNSDFNAILGVSPFITDGHVLSVSEHLEKAGIKLIKGDSLDLLAVADMLVTLPGTNTAEAMYLQTPMCVLVPLNRPDLIILDGLGGLIGKIPGVGILIKKAILFFLKRKKQYYAQPNRIANKELVPEWVDVLTVSQVAKNISSYYFDPVKLAKIKENLRPFKPSLDVLENIVATIFKQK